MTDLIWTSTAFQVLERLPQAIAFGIVRQTDLLRRFPEMGSPFLTPKHLTKYRQLIFRKTYRTIYRFDTDENCIRIVNIHNCRQKFPTAKQITRADRDDRELPLE